MTGRREEPTQLEIADELETWEEWFASLLPMPQAASEEEEEAG